MSSAFQALLVRFGELTPLLDSADGEITGLMEWEDCSLKLSEARSEQNLCN